MKVAAYLVALPTLLSLLGGCGSGGPTNGTATTSTIVTTTTIASTTIVSTTTAPPGRPNANPGGPYEGMVERPLQFNGRGSTGSTQLNYFWDFGDGSAGGRGPMPTHTYASFCPTPTDPTEMTFTITLQVRDNLGQEDTDTTTALILCTY